MGIKQECELCGEKTHRQIKKVPICIKCRDSVYAERDRMEMEMLDKVKDKAVQNNMKKFINTRYALSNLLQKREDTSEK